MLYFWRGDDFVVWLFVVVDFDCVNRGVGAGAVSVEGDSGGERFDDGAANSIYFAAGSVVYGDDYRVGDCDAADYFA